MLFPLCQETSGRFSFSCTTVWSSLPLSLLIVFMFRAFKSASNLTSLINILHNQVYHSTYSVHLHLSPHTSTLFLFAVGSSFAEVFLPVRLTVQFIVFCLQYIWFARNTLCKFNYYHYFLLYMLYIHIIQACVNVLYK